MCAELRPMTAAVSKSPPSLVPFLDAIERGMNQSTERIAAAINNQDSERLYVEAHRLFSLGATIRHAHSSRYNARELTSAELQSWEAALTLCFHVGHMLKASVEENPATIVDSSKCFLYLARLRTAAAICSEVRRNWTLRQKV